MVLLSAHEGTVGLDYDLVFLAVGNYASLLAPGMKLVW